MVAAEGAGRVGVVGGLIPSHVPCHGNNATPPSPAEAPGIESLDLAAAVEAVRSRGPGGVDQRLRAALPALDAPFLQAGLAGYSDAAMRIVARRHGAPACVTEALLDRMLLGGGRGFDKADLVSRDEDLLSANLPCGHEDHPLIGQIIGSDPDEMAAGALKMIEQGQRRAVEYRELAYGEGKLPAYVDTRWQPAGEPNGSAAATRERTFAGIDVNLACPVKKIDRKHRGGHWLGEPEGAIEILRAVRSAVPRGVPCTVKLRRGYDDSPESVRNFERIFDAAFELGYAWATVHARTVEQRYVGPSRWSFLRDLCRRRADAVVIGSGDVWEAEDIVRMIAYCGVSAVSVARGAIGNPWIFTRARDLLAGRTPRAPSIDEQRRALEDHFALSVAINGERHAARMMRKFGIKFARHLPPPLDAEAKTRMASASSAAEWREALDACYGVAPAAAAQP